MESIQALKRLGFRIAIDDFGSGYSSIGYLRKIPIDTLKIDKSLVVDIMEDEKTALLTVAIIYIAHYLGMRTVAEGIETKGHFDFLEKYCCDRVQGYFISRPMPLDELISFIRADANRN